MLKTDVHHIYKQESTQLASCANYNSCCNKFCFENPDCRGCAFETSTNDSEKDIMQIKYCIPCMNVIQLGENDMDNDVPGPDFRTPEWKKMSMSRNTLSFTAPTLGNIFSQKFVGGKHSLLEKKTVRFRKRLKALYLQKKSFDLELFGTSVNKLLGFFQSYAKENNIKDMSSIIHCLKCIIVDSDILIEYKRKSEKLKSFLERGLDRESTSCTVYLEELYSTKNITKLLYGHYFHWACIQQYFQNLQLENKKINCPVCRQHVIGFDTIPSPMTIITYQ